MMIPVYDIQGFQLDWMVAEALGYKPRIYGTDSIRAELPSGGVLAPFQPTFLWQQAGPLIVEHKIGFRILTEDDTAILDIPGEWRAFTENGVYVCEGQTPLIASMRCIVASKLGRRIHVPDHVAAITRIKA